VEIFDIYFTSQYGSDRQRARHDENFASICPSESFYTPVEREAVRLVMRDPSQRRVLLGGALEA